MDDLGNTIKSAITEYKEPSWFTRHPEPQVMSGNWIRYGSTLTEVTNGLMFGFSKVRSALETRKYIILAGFESFIDMSDHRFMWCGASV